MNFSIFKKKDKDKNINTTENEIFYMGDLYVAWPALLTRNNKKDSYIYNGNETEDPIICKLKSKLKSNNQVINVLNGREYYLLGKILLSGKIVDFVGKYIVDDLTPLEHTLEGPEKLKIQFTRAEIIELLYPKKDNKTQNDIQDIILKQIDGTNTKINKSCLTREVKETLKNKLIELAYYYADSLKRISQYKDSVNLEKNNISIIDLRREVMSKLVEIELQLPPENVDTLYKEIDLLEHKIRKK